MRGLVMSDFVQGSDNLGFNMANPSLSNGK
jgi:hypothetical protein